MLGPLFLGFLKPGNLVNKKVNSRRGEELALFTIQSARGGAAAPRRGGRGVKATPPEGHAPGSAEPRRAGRRRPEDLGKGSRTAGSRAGTAGRRAGGPRRCHGAARAGRRLRRRHGLVPGEVPEPALPRPLPRGPVGRGRRPGSAHVWARGAGSRRLRPRTLALPAADGLYSVLKVSLGDSGVSLTCSTSRRPGPESDRPVALVPGQFVAFWEPPPGLRKAEAGAPASWLLAKVG